MFLLLVFTAVSAVYNFTILNFHLPIQLVGLQYFVLPGSSTSECPKGLHGMMGKENTQNSEGITIVLLVLVLARLPSTTTDH
jgi:hypothetical protein